MTTSRPISDPTPPPIPENVTNNEMWFDDYEPVAGIEEFKQIFNSLLTAFSFLGVILNICVIQYSRRLRKTTGDLTHCFVSSMASADLLLCCFAQPFEFILHKLTAAKLVSLPESICRTQHLIYWLGYSASGLSLTLLNLDKLLFFKWPLHYGMVGTNKTAAISISICWLVCGLGSIVLVVPSVLQLSPIGDCNTVSISPELYIFYTISFCTFPVVSSAIVSVYLARLVQQMRRDTSAYTSDVLDDYTIQQRMRAMAFIFITTAWTFMALTPYRVFNVIRIYQAKKWFTDRATLIAIHWIGYIFIYLLSLNPSVNPCLTLITYAPYKNLFKMRLYKIKLAIFSLLGRPIDHREHDLRAGRFSLTQSEWV